MRSLLLIIILLLTFIGYAQENPYKLSQISLAEGLSQSIVYDIAQDEAGYLWFGTQDGLNRYDGINFEIFKNEPFDTTSISSNQISSLLFDSKKRLWIGTHNHGLNLFIKNNRTFRVIYGQGEEKDVILNKSSIRCLFEDTRGIIWIGTPRGIVSIDNNYKIIEYPVRTNDTDTLPAYVNSIVEFGDDILIATGKGLFYLNRQNNKIEYISALPYEKIEKQWIFTLAFDNINNRIYAGTHTGLFKFTLNNKSINNIESLYFGNPVPALTIKNESILVSIDGKGLFTITQNNNENQLKQINVTLPPSIQSNEIQEIITLHYDEINEGMIWAGTSTKGVLKINPVLKNFHTDRFRNTNLSGSFVTSIIKDKDNNKWIGSPEGLLRLNPAGEYSHFNTELEINNFKKNYVASLAQDKSGRLWIGKVNGILYCDNPSADKPVFKIANTIKNRTTEVIRSFYESSNGDFFAVSKRSILQFNPEKNSFEVIITDPDSAASNQPGYNLNCMLIDAKNNLWIGSSSGLIRRNIYAQQQIFYHKKDDTLGLRDHSIQHIYEDLKGNIWLSTTNGFSKITEINGTYRITNYSSHDGLSNNFVYAILEDKNAGNLWISTNGGLTSFNPEKNIFLTFNIHDGLQSNEFNSGAFSLSYDGEMYFGGIDGYTSFYPSEIKLDSTPPRVFISVFNIPGKEKRLIFFDEIESKKVDLKYFENSFTVSFTALHFVNPTKNTYAYKLEGYRDDWIYSGNLNSINFSQLPAGDYTLRVKAANSDGIYNEAGDTLLISISSPLWQTAWFYAIVLVFIGLILFGLHRYRLSLKMQQVLAIDKIRKETAEDFHDELGHKLTTISWFGEIARSKIKSENDDVKIYLDKIVETSQQMYHTMKDLLWAMDPEKDTINDLYTQIKEFGEDIFDKTGIEFNSSSNVDLKGNKILPLHHKRQVILIFKEVMHNTLKHSEANKAEFKLIKSNGQIHFQFLDNGKGYTLNGNPTGFGLKNVKRRSEMLQADLKIASTGKGTSVDLSFNSN